MASGYSSQKPRVRKRPWALLLIALGLMEAQAVHLVNRQAVSVSEQVHAANRGIIDRALQKFQAKEDDSIKVEQAAALIEKEKIETATRKAIQLTQHSEDADIHELNLKMMKKDLQIKPASTGKAPQKEVTEDDISSISEIAKNKVSLAEKQVDADKEKDDRLKAAKARMKQALDQSNQPQAAEMVQQDIKPPKLVDSSITQVIDEVSSEQDAQMLQKKIAPAAPVAKDEAGFIKQFATKQFGGDEESAEAKPEENEETSGPAKKGMSERFRDIVDQDMKDEAKLNELVHQQEHQEQMKKKSVLERETERLVRDIGDAADDDSTATV